MSQPLQEYSSSGSNGYNLPQDICDQLQNAWHKRTVGHATTFTTDKALTLLNEIIDGKTVAQACIEVGISRATFYIWRSVVPGFLDMISQAHELQADSMMDDSVKDLSTVDTEGKEAMARLRKAEQVARFKFDLAKCLNFKKYGDKKQSLNLNVNAQVSESDVAKWFNK